MVRVFTVKTLLSLPSPLPLNTCTPRQTHNLLVLLPQFIWHLFPQMDQRLVLKIILSPFKTRKRKLKRNIGIKNCFLVLRFSEISSQKKNWWKSSWVKDAKWLGRVHQLDLQTCTLPERLKRMQKHYRVEDAKRITQFSSARFANTPEWLNISFFLIWIINKSILFNKSDERLWKRVSDRKLKKKSFCIGNKLFATSSVEQARDRNKTLLNMRVMQVLGKIYEGDIS